MTDTVGTKWIICKEQILEAIDKKYMEPRDVKALNDYHAEVYKRVSPLIKDPKILNWLREATREI